MLAPIYYNLLHFITLTGCNCDHIFYSLPSINMLIQPSCKTVPIAKNKSSTSLSRCMQFLTAVGSFLKLK